MQNQTKKETHIEKEYISDPKSKFSDYFSKNKAEKIKSKLPRSARDKINFAGDYYQNCMEWSHYMKKSELDTRLKVVKLVNAFMRIKNRNLRMYCDVSKTLYGVGIYEYAQFEYEYASEYAPFQVPYEYWMTRSERKRLALVSRFFT